MLMEEKMKKLNWLKKTAKVLTSLGAINWGVIALLNVNLVTSILGTMPGLVTFVYALVGISGIYTLWDIFMK
jgi:hypothetical protein